MMKNENDIMNLVLARLSVMPEHIAIRFGDKNEELKRTIDYACQKTG